MKITFRPRVEWASDTAVFVDGVEAAFLRKRGESYTGIKGGGRYTYFDFYRVGEKHPGRETRLGCDTLRKRALAEGFVALGMDEAARTADLDHADFYIRKRVAA